MPPKRAGTPTPKGTPRKGVGAAKGGPKAPTISPRQVPANGATPRTAAAMAVQRQARKGAGRKKAKKRDPDAEIATFLHVMGIELAKVEAEGRERHRSDVRLDAVHVAVLQPELRALEHELEVREAQLKVAQLSSKPPGRITNLESDIGGAVRLLQEEEVRTREPAGARTPDLVRLHGAQNHRICFDSGRGYRIRSRGGSRTAAWLRTRTAALHRIRTARTVSRLQLAAAPAAAFCARHV